MKGRIVLYLLCLWGWIIPKEGYAQVTVDASIDTLLIRIGEQTHVHLQVSMDAGSQYDFPQFKDTIIAGVECLQTSDPVVEMLNDGKRMLVTRDYLITSFDSGHYYLPPFEVLVNQKPYRSKNLSLKVFSVEVNLDRPNEFCGPKDVMSVPFVWEDWMLVFWLAVVLLPMVALCIYLVVRLRDNKPIIKRIHLTPKLPPHQKAMKEIEAIKSEKSWTPEDSKEYYTKLTDALRVYIKERYRFNATEMTSGEIIQRLTEEKDENALEELNMLFQTADLVKFAKYNTLINENDRNLVNAIEFINQTKVEIDPATLNRESEMTVEEKRSRKMKIVLIAGITGLVVGSLVVIVYIGFELYRLCF